jgi:hypothetical protein
MDSQEGVDAMAELTTGLINNPPVAGEKPVTMFAIKIKSKSDVVTAVQISGFLTVGAVRTLYALELISIKPGEILTKKYFANFKAFEFQFVTSSEEMGISAWSEDSEGNVLEVHPLLPLKYEPKEVTTETEVEGTIGSQVVTQEVKVISAAETKDSKAAFAYVYQLADINDAIVAAGADVPFANNGPLVNITHRAGSAGITVNIEGTYLIDYIINITSGMGSVMAIAVNGVVDGSTVIEALVGSGQIAGQVILPLVAHEVISLRNNSSVPLTLNMAPGVGAQLSVTRLDDL